MDSQPEIKPPGVRILREETAQPWTCDYCDKEFDSRSIQWSFLGNALEPLFVRRLDFCGDCVRQFSAKLSQIYALFDSQL